MSKLGLAKSLLALAVAGFMIGGSVARAETQEEMARDLVPAQKPLFQLGGSTPEAGLAVDAWVDNPDLTYRVGQQLKVFVRPKQTSYITVLNLGSSGRVSVIFPNFYQRDMRVRAGHTVSIPADPAGWRIDVAGPPGVEVIKVIASRKPLNLPELQRLASATEQEPVLSLGRSGEEVARDLVPLIKDPTSGAGILPGGVRSLLVRVLPRGAALPTFPFATPKLTGAFGLVLRTERPVYRIGETVRVAVAVQKDCRLTLVSLGTSGEAVRLFPNPFQTDDLIRAGQTVVIPSFHSPIQFKARGPVGVEGLLATCRGTSAPMQAAGASEGGFVTIGDLASVTRDLVAASADGDYAVEQVSGSILITN